MTRIHFAEVALHGKKRGRCVNCGKVRTRSRRFWQTVNPFNKRADGAVKTPDDIRRELSEQVTLWQREPIMCCEDRDE